MNDDDCSPDSLLSCLMRPLMNITRGAAAVVDCDGSLDRDRDSGSELADQISSLVANAPAAPDGYFGIGVYNSKHAENVGTLWRSAFMLGASYVFTCGTRNAWEKQSADTHKAWRRLPAIRYDDWAGFCASAPYGAVWVAVEMGGTPLHEFEHPERAVYLLGAEDAGLPPAVTRACHHCVSLEGVRANSYNVSTAGTLIMYDRLRKLVGRAATAKHAANGGEKTGQQ